MPAPVPHILLIDDSPSDCELVRIALAMCDVQARLDTAHDGREAINALQQSLARGELPSLILLDLKMPRLDGFDLLSLLGEISLLDRVNVVVLTTSNQPADRSRCLTLGARAFFTKPHDLAGMRQLVRDLGAFLPGGGTHRPSSRQPTPPR